jgi:hypothetical protein
MHAQRAAAALLIFLNMDPATAGETGSKYLEYLGARRPILAFGPPNSALREAIVSNRLGWFASNAQEAMDALRAAYSRYVSGRYEATIDERAFPSAPELAGRFAECLDAALNARAVVSTGYAARAVRRS